MRTKSENAAMSDKTVKGFKFVSKDLTSQKTCRWKVGVWKHHKGKLKLCLKGFHASLTPLQNLEYINGDRWFFIEAKGEILYGEDKFVASSMRLVKEIKNVKEISVDFSIACAKHVLKNYDDKYPNDFRVRNAIKAAKKVLLNPSKENINAAKSAESAAHSAAWRATQSSAWSAQYAAWSAQSAVQSAAQPIAWSAWSSTCSAQSAAWCAFRSAWSALSDWFAERERQEKKLKAIINKWQKKKGVFKNTHEVRL